MQRALACAALALACTAHAQTGPAWQGEWGSFTGAHAEVGRRISIWDCKGNTCRFALEVRSAVGNAGTTGDQTFAVETDGIATAQLADGDKKAFCSLRLQRSEGEHPAVQVTATGTVCTSYYATNAAVTFTGTYPRQAAVLYVGMHVDECFLKQSPALLAICTHPALDTLERQWEELATEFPLKSAATSAQSRYEQVQAADRALVSACDHDGNPESCLTQRYSSEIAAMQAKQNAYLAGTQERGDPAVGGPLARKIAGQYRNREENGDVQGHTFMTTDTLTIVPVGAASIHFKTFLNFFNGHSCSLEGGALYRQDGSFVFDDTAENAPEGAPACRLAIVPSNTGITFRDINGSCKNYCGMRGGWNGAGFSFTQRIHTAAPRSGK